MAKYKRCPRCELNYIIESEDLCQVCKAELKLAPSEEDLELCPLCGKNLITVDQVMCDDCAKSRNLDDVVDEGMEEDNDLPSSEWDDEDDREGSELGLDSSRVDDEFSDLDESDDFSDDEDEEEEDDQYHGEDVDEFEMDDFDIEESEIEEEDEDDDYNDDYDDDGDFLSKKNKK